MPHLNRAEDRICMPKKVLKRWLPSPQYLKEHKSLQFLGKLLHDPNLFHLNRHSVSGAFFVGLFIAFLPTFGQMPLAALAALLFRVNLPISVLLVWISNPITMPPLFFATYELGRWILNSPSVHFTMELSWDWFSSQFPNLWKPLLLGCVLTGFVCGALGYGVMQLFWRWHVLRSWAKRKRDRAQRQG